MQLIGEALLDFAIQTACLSRDAEVFLQFIRGVI